jgi:hypothetical protein
LMRAQTEQGIGSITIPAQDSKGKPIRMVNNVLINQRRMTGPVLFAVPVDMIHSQPYQLGLSTTGTLSTEKINDLTLQDLPFSSLKYPAHLTTPITYCSPTSPGVDGSPTFTQSSPLETLMALRISQFFDSEMPITLRKSRNYRVCTVNAFSPQPLFSPKTFVISCFINHSHLQLNYNTNLLRKEGSHVCK